VLPVQTNVNTREQHAFMERHTHDTGNLMPRIAKIQFQTHREMEESDIRLQEHKLEEL